MHMLCNVNQKYRRYYIYMQNVFFKKIGFPYFVCISLSVCVLVTFEFHPHGIAPTKTLAPVEGLAYSVSSNLTYSMAILKHGYND